MLPNRFSVKKLESALTTIRSARPAYAAILDFYGQIFMLQEESKRRLQLDRIIISAEILSIKMKENLPLIGPGDFNIDTEASLALFERICDIAQNQHAPMAASARILNQMSAKRELDPRHLFTGLLSGKEELLDATAHDIDAQALGFIVYASVQPSITQGAVQLSTYLKSEALWEAPYCPICGNTPVISALEDDGRRRLFCGFCWYPWFAPRIGCPYCGNKNSDKLYYFYSEEEKAYRVDVCQACRKYIKTVDTRKTDQWFYAPLELISTLHLDMQAQEKGLTSEPISKRFSLVNL